MVLVAVAVTAAMCVKQLMQQCVCKASDAAAVRGLSLQVSGLADPASEGRMTSRRRRVSPSIYTVVYGPAAGSYLRLIDIFINQL